MKNRKVVGVILGVFVLMVVWISGCATTDTATPAPAPEPLLPGQVVGEFTVAVDSIAAPDADLKGKTYLIVSSMQGPGSSDIKEALRMLDENLQFQEFARYIENALSQKGYVRVRQPEAADLVIGFAYNVGDPQTTTETRIISPEYKYQEYYAFEWRWVTVPAKTQTFQITTYLRSFMLEAYSKDRKQLWKTTVWSRGKMSDLRIVLPFMITAAVPYLGENTIGQQVITIDGRDKRVLDIRK